MFINRVKKNYAHLKSWAKRENITAFRIYEKDIPQYPFIVDYYDGAFVVYASLKEEFEDDAGKIDIVLNSLQEFFKVPASVLFVKSRQRQKGIAQYERISENRTLKIVQEGNMKFIVNLSDYLDTGLFLDHRKTRQLIAGWSAGKTVLNLFSYTGSLSVAAGLGQAKSVVSVDMSATYTNWAKDNFKLNGLSVEANKFYQEDILQWLPEYAKKLQEKFDLIIIDPPSFSNSKRMQGVFDVQEDHVNLLKTASQLLNLGGKIFFSNNLRGFKIHEEELQEFSIKNFSDKTLPQDFRNKKIHQSWLLELKG